MTFFPIILITHSSFIHPKVVPWLFCFFHQLTFNLLLQLFLTIYGLSHNWLPQVHNCCFTVLFRIGPWTVKWFDSFGCGALKQRGNPSTCELFPGWNKSWDYGNGRCTLPETNIAPENGWLEYRFLLDMRISEIKTLIINHNERVIFPGKTVSWKSPTLRWFAPIFQAYLGWVWTAFSPREGGVSGVISYTGKVLEIQQLLTPRFSCSFHCPWFRCWNSPFGGVFWFWPIKTCMYLGKHGTCSSNSKFLTCVNTSSYGPRWSERHVACSKTCPPRDIWTSPEN